MTYSFRTVSLLGTIALSAALDIPGGVLDSVQHEGAVATVEEHATLEIRSGDNPQGSLDSFQVAAKGTLEGTTELSFDEPVTARYLLVWFTGLVDQGDGFSADLAEVEITSAG